MNGRLFAIHEATCKQRLQVRSLLLLEPNMGLTTWKGGRVRKQDVIIAKNYLSHHAGKLRADVAERLAADREDVAALEQMERKLENKGRGKKK